MFLCQMTSRFHSKSKILLHMTSVVFCIYFQRTYLLKNLKLESTKNPMLFNNLLIPYFIIFHSALNFLKVNHEIVFILFALFFKLKI
jgi:hypothetical protein